MALPPNLPSVFKWNDYFLCLFERFEKGIVALLSVFMAVVVLSSTVELAILLAKDLLVPPFFHLGIAGLLDIFGYFLMVLLGLELLEILKAYLHDEKVPVEVVLLVAIIAIARKIIILDLKETPMGILLGLAALLVSLSFGYFVIRRVLLPSSPR